MNTYINTKAEWEMLLACLEAVNVPGKITEMHAALKVKVREMVNNPTFVDAPEPAASPSV